MLGTVNQKMQHLDALPWQDLLKLYAAIPDTVSGLCLRWSILTVVRPGAARGAKFCEINGDLWTVPADWMKVWRAKSGISVSLFHQRLCVLPKHVASSQTITSFRQVRQVRHRCCCHQSLAINAPDGDGAWLQILVPVVGTGYRRVFVRRCRNGTRPSNRRQGRTDLRRVRLAGPQTHRHGGVGSVCDRCSR